MHHMEPLPHQGIYAPLSQAMTDSESDEEIEIHNSSKHRFQQQQLKQQQQTEQLKQIRRNPPNSLALQQRNTHNKPNRSEAPVDRNQPEQLQQQLQFHREQRFQLSSRAVIGNGHPPSSYTANMQNTFRSVMLTDMNMHGADFSNFNSDYDADNVAILGTSAETKIREPMSRSRRCCFIASLLLCFLAVVSFIWIVPCNDSSTCPAPMDRVKTHNWLNNYTKIELKGGVNVVTGLRAWEKNLVFLYRGDTFFPEFRPSNTKRNGIISLIGSSGAVAWYDEMTDDPVAIDCTLLDVDRNGRPDCLVIDEYGEIGAINPVSGQWHWRFKERSARKVDATDFPVILPDLNDDGVLEILLVSSAKLEQRTKANVEQGKISKQNGRNILRILSGRNGKHIGEGFTVHDCDVVRNLQLVNSLSITYTCVNNNTEAQRPKTLAELYSLITNESNGNRKPLPASKISQHRHWDQRKEADTQRNIYSLSGRELLVENRGKCPEDCNVTMLLTKTLNGETSVLRNFTISAMYGMVPAQWHFKNTKSKMSGFVMKFWKWSSVNRLVQQQNKTKSQNTTLNCNNTNCANMRTNNNNPSNKVKNNNSDKSRVANTIKDNATKPNKQQQHQVHTNKTKKTRQKRNGESMSDALSTDDEFDTFDHIIEKRNAYHVPTKEQSEGNRAVKSSSSNLLADNYRKHRITESVVLILFIGAETRIENTSQSNIIQFCRNDGPQDEVCQPDLNNQEHSMLIADLDQDGSQELVSYMTTFVQTNDEIDDWKLVTYVRLLRLQSELPAFYEDAKRT